MEVSKKSVGLSAVAGLATSFTVLIEGVASGRDALNEAWAVYSVAAMLLAVSGATYFCSLELPEPAPSEDLKVRLALADLRGVQAAAWIGRMTIQLLAFVLGFALAFRVGYLPAMLFMLGIFWMYLAYKASSGMFQVVEHARFVFRELAKLRRPHE
jgi:hypothetical protein